MDKNRMENFNAYESLSSVGNGNLKSMSQCMYICNIHLMKDTQFSCVLQPFILTLLCGGGQEAHWFLVFAANRKYINPIPHEEA